MAIYKTPDLSGKIINLTRTSYDAYSASGEIVTLHSSNEKIKRPRWGTYYVVTKEQADNNVELIHSTPEKYSFIL